MSWGKLRQMLMMLQAEAPGVIRLATDAEIAKYVSGEMQNLSDRVTIKVEHRGAVLDQVNLSVGDLLYIQQQFGPVRSKPSPGPFAVWGAGYVVAGPDAFQASIIPGFGAMTISRLLNDCPPPPPPPSPLWDNPQTVTEEIIAYRGWNYQLTLDAEMNVGVVLTSLHFGYRWYGPVAIADETPTAENRCGLHAVGDESRHRTNFNDYVKDQPIWGRVALSGTVVEGEYGYRAERATIQELWINPDVADGAVASVALAVLLGDRYQCDASVKRPRWWHDIAKVKRLLPKGRADAEVTE